MCDMAGDIAREEVLKALKRYGVTVGRVAKRLSEGLDAHEVKAFKTKDDDIIYSKKLVAHSIRMDAVKTAIPLLDMKPPEKQEIDLKQPINLVIKEFYRGERPKEGES